jgi:hypothetical protein
MNRCSCNEHPVNLPVVVLKDHNNEENSSAERWACSRMDLSVLKRKRLFSMDRYGHDTVMPRMVEIVMAPPDMDK